MFFLKPVSSSHRRCLAELFKAISNFIHDFSKVCRAVTKAKPRRVLFRQPTIARLSGISWWVYCIHSNSFLQLSNLHYIATKCEILIFFFLTPLTNLGFLGKGLSVFAFQMLSKTQWQPKSNTSYVVTELSCRLLFFRRRMSFTTDNDNFVFSLRIFWPTSVFQTYWVLGSIFAGLSSEGGSAWTREGKLIDTVVEVEGRVRNWSLSSRCCRIVE